MGSYVNIYSDYRQFLELVANWIRQHMASSSSRCSLVCEVMRDANQVWFGVGVYTVCEILFMAGMFIFKIFYYLNRQTLPLLANLNINHPGVSPFLKEVEVFDNPSRTSQICEAFWAYQHKTITDLPCVFINDVICCHIFKKD